jgi:DNA-binding HxlR family transcriptional regulator
MWGMDTATRCRESILRTLYCGDAGFEEMVEALKGVLSRGTVNKYLREMYNEGLVKQKVGRGARKYYLSDAGKTLAGKVTFRVKADVANLKSPEEIKKALQEMEEIIKIALKTPNSHLDAFFSCVMDVSDKSSGIFRFKKGPARVRSEENDRRGET